MHGDRSDERNSRVSKQLLLSTEPSSAAQASLDLNTNGTVPSEPLLGSVTDAPAETRWTSLFAGNRTEKNGLSLKFVAPELINGNPVVQLDKQEVEQEAEKWKCSLIAYIVGDSPGYHYMKNRRYGHRWLLLIYTVMKMIIMC